MWSPLVKNIVMVFDRSDFDPDATVVSSGLDQTVQPVPKPEPAMPQPSYGVIPPQPSSQSAPAYQPPVQEEPEQDLEQLRSKMKPKKKGMPAWLIVLIIAICGHRLCDRGHFVFHARFLVVRDFLQYAGWLPRSITVSLF